MISREQSVLLIFSIAAVGATFLFPRFPQPQSYHDFADQRPILGIHNGWNVLSNIPLSIAGVVGLVCLLAYSPASIFASSIEKTAYVAFFVGNVLMGIGSAYYHLAPDNQRLMWDRLPIPVSLLALFDAVLAERNDPRLAKALFFPLVALGVVSVLYWIWTERRGKGDLRPYGLAQTYPFIGIVVLLALKPARSTGAKWLVLALIGYSLARAFELLDKPVQRRLRIIGGHPLKHFLAAAAALFVLWMLMVRSAK